MVFIKKINRIIALVVTLLLAVSLALPMTAYDYNPYADALNALGLFKGTGNGYELERTPTRAEALTLLIRLLGKEDEALRGNFEHPFTDAGWADKYIGYAYENRITNGISKTEFGTFLPMTAQQYATLLMRALGYSDDVGGQFTYAGAYEFALHKLAIDGMDGEFTRGELARMSFAAMNATLYNSTKTLATSLMSKKVFTQSDYSSANLIASDGEIKTAVLIYAVASDLESKLGMLSMDIMEITDAASGKVEILMQAGGTKNYRNTALTDGATQRFRLTNGEISDMEVLDGAKMCERETLEEFLEYAYENVEADRYVLVFWDHGEGTLGGFGRDELNGDDSLSLDDMKTALAASGKKPDVIVFDACLMSTVECAYALSGTAEYMIASEDITPTDGLYYTTWLSSLSANPRLTTESLVRLIVDAYVVHAPQDRTDVTMAVIRLDNAARLANGVARELERISKNPALLKKLESIDVKPYGANEGNDQYDLIALLDALDMDISTVYTELEGALYYKRSAVQNKYSGIAVYLPLIRSCDYEYVKADLQAIGYPEAAITTLDKIYGG